MSTAYPLAIDGPLQLPIAEDLISLVNSDIYNKLRGAIIAIESELGVKPSGVTTTVKARVDYLEAYVKLLIGDEEIYPTVGDISGVYPNLTVERINGTPVPLFSSLTKGDILYFNGTGWVSLTPGTSGQYLQTQGTGANPQWSTISIVNADVNASAAIAGTKISPDFGSQNILTTGNITGTNLIGSSLDYAGVLNIGTVNASAINVGQVGKTITINGNVIVSGSTTSIETNTLDVSDRVIHVNNSTGIVPAPSNLAGISVHRGSVDGYVDRHHAGLFWNETSSRFEFAFDDAGNDTTITSYLPIKASDGYFSNIKLSSLAVSSYVKTNGSSELTTTSTIPISDLYADSQAQGDLIYRNNTSWVRLPAGTSGHVLQTQGAGANPQWVSPSGTPTGSAGGDLDGSYPNPTVKGLTGTLGVVSFGTSISTPIINQLVTTGDTGQALTLQAQNAAITGGALTLTSGTGATTAGNVVIQTGGTTKLSVTPSTVSVTVGSNQEFRFNRGIFNENPSLSVINSATSGKAGGFLSGTAGTVFYFDDSGYFGIISESRSNINSNSGGGGPDIIRFKTSEIIPFKNIYFDTTVSSPIISQATTGSSSGQSLTIQAQNAAATGGNLILASGTGSAAGTISINTGSAQKVLVQATKTSVFTAGTQEFRFNQGASAITPTFTILNSSGKAGGFLVGTNATAFFFDNSGTFSIISESRSSGVNNINNDTAGSGTELVRVNTTDFQLGGIPFISNNSSFNGNVASTGDFRTRNNTTILAARNAANNADISVIGTNSSNNITIGSLLTVSSASVLIGSSVSTPSILQTTTAGDTGEALTVQAQNAAITGGALKLTSGTGATTAGNVVIQTGGTTKVSVAPTTTSVFTATGQEYRFNQGNNNSTPNIAVFATPGKAAALMAGTATSGFAFDSSAPFSIIAQTRASMDSNGVGLGTEYLRITPTVGSEKITLYVPFYFASTVLSPGFRQEDLAGVTGKNLTIQAQNATGATSTGGNLNLTSGTGTSVTGNVNIQTGGTNRIVVSPTSTTVSNSLVNTNSRVINIGSLKTADYTITNSDHCIFAGTLSIPITFTLPSSPATGQLHIIKDARGSAATNNITIVPQGSHLIDGSASYILGVNYGCIYMVFDGTHWSAV